MYRMRTSAKRSNYYYNKNVKSYAANKIKAAFKRRNYTLIQKRIRGAVGMAPIYRRRR